MLSGKRIVLGITGGIAAYKAAILLRAFQKAGAQVRVTMTPAAQQFIGSETLASLSRHPVAIDIFPDQASDADSWTRHIDWGEWADLMVIAPCTANTLAKIAGGFSDNMLTATILAARCPLLVCPTMDGEMYESPAVQRNLESLHTDGMHLLEPESGYLASGLEGKGRLPETEAILQECEALLQQRTTEGPLSGKKVVVTAGPTREYIDPVRYISNPSSGKMGLAMAEAAHKLGAEVTLIHGPIQLPLPHHFTTRAITSAKELFEAVKHHGDADVIIMAAAVADFTPATKARQKIKKERQSSTLELQRTTDILAWLGEHKKEGQTLIGFAMETENMEAYARKKREEKKIDWIIANTISGEDSAFGSDTNSVMLIGANSSHTFSDSKTTVAQQILDTIFN